MPTGPAGGRIAIKKRPLSTFQKKTDAELFGPFFVVLRLRLREEGAPRFRVVAEFWVTPEHPTGLTDDDATTTTRNTKLASYASARPPVPRVRHVFDWHGGAGWSSPSPWVASRSCCVPRREAQGQI